MMLLTDVLTKVLRLWDDDALAVPEPNWDHIPLMTLQILVRTLSAQSDDGSWRGSPEITAYGLLTLKRLLPLPWTTALAEKTRESIYLATKFLEAKQESWSTPEFIWVEKVTYGSGILAEAYCLAALRASPSEYLPGDRVVGLYRVPTTKLDGLSEFFARLPLFTAEPGWRIHASMLEGSLLAPRLRAPQPWLEIFPEQKRGKYLEYIPFTWTLCNNATGFGISTRTMCDMMVISVLNFQVDKFLEEATEAESLGGDFEALRATIRRVLEHHDPDQQNGGGTSSPLNGARKRTINGDHKPPPTSAVPNGGKRENGISDPEQGGGSKSKLLHDVEEALGGFVSHVLEHPRAATAAPRCRLRLRRELSNFLQAHVTQGEDNASMRAAGGGPGGASYYDWVRTTSADHTSCPYSFCFFFSCLVAAPGADCFAGARASYLSQDVCRHLATLCRQYNDYGSVARDREEGNLNSVDFAEFSAPTTSTTSSTSREAVTVQESDDGPRTKLLEIATYERECLELAMDRLRPDVDPRTWAALQVFVNVTDLYGQIYVARDINAGSAGGNVKAASH